MASAFAFPFVVVVLAVRHHLQDENLLTAVKDADNKPEFVAADIKYDAVADQARSEKSSLDITPRVPRNGLAVDMSVPRTQRSHRSSVARRLPKLPQARLGDDPHPPLLA